MYKPIRCPYCNKYFFDNGEVKCPLCQKNIDNTLQKLKDLFDDNNPFNDLGIT